MSGEPLNEIENPSQFSGLSLTTRPLTPLEKVAKAKADLEGLDAQRAHYHRQYVKAIHGALAEYSQREIAAKIGIPQRTLSDLVRKR